VLKRLKAKINKSCGLHVHFDAKQMSLTGMKNLWNNYQTLEGSIDAFLPISRRESNNRFCQPLRSVISTAKVNAATSKRDLATKMPTRYGKLNLQSYLRHETVEFRHHSGTIEFEKINNWILFCHSLAEFSENNKITTQGFEAFATSQVQEYINLRTNELAA
jgi:hypothetical protein